MQNLPVAKCTPYRAHILSLPKDGCCRNLRICPTTRCSVSTAGKGLKQVMPIRSSKALTVHKRTDKGSVDHPDAIGMVNFSCNLSSCVSDFYCNFQDRTSILKIIIQYEESDSSCPHEICI